MFKISIRELYNKCKMKSQTIKRFLVMSVLFNFLFIGAVFNLDAQAVNGGKMPVLSEDNYETATHFSFQDKNDVGRWYFTDIIRWGNGRVWSIGDFILITSFTLIFIFGTRYSYMGVKEWKQKKNVESLGKLPR